VHDDAPNAAAPDWRGACAICLEFLPVEIDRQVFYDCCCKRICAVCSAKCVEHDERCPLCRSAPFKSDAEWVRRIQTHVDKGNAEAQFVLGSHNRVGGMGLKKSAKRAYQLFELAAAQGHAGAQFKLGCCYQDGLGVKSNFKVAAMWYRRAAEQGYPNAQTSLATMFCNGKGVAQSFDEAVRWYGLAAAQGYSVALYMLGACYEYGQGVPEDRHEAMRHYKRAAAKGYADAAAKVEELQASLDGP
jgi:TPR repeat protein